MPLLKRKSRSDTKRHKKFDDVYELHNQLKRPKSNIYHKPTSEPILISDVKIKYTGALFYDLYNKNTKQTQEKILEEINSDYNDYNGYIYCAEDKYDLDNGFSCGFGGTHELKIEGTKQYNIDSLLSQQQCELLSITSVNNYKKVKRLVHLFLHYVNIKKYKNGTNQKGWFTLNREYMPAADIHKLIKNVELLIQYTEKYYYTHTQFYQFIEDF